VVRKLFLYNISLIHTWDRLEELLV
jgi:hypothetical protein